MGRLSNLKDLIEEIFYYRLEEIGYADREDVIIDYCIEACPYLENKVEWEIEEEE